MRMQFPLDLMHLESRKTAEPSQASPESATRADRITYLLKVILMHPSLKSPVSGKCIPSLRENKYSLVLVLLKYLPLIAR